MLSRAILLIGGAALTTVLLGSVVYIAIEGLIPAEEIVQTATSRNQGAILYTGAILGGAAALAGWTTYKRMPTKASRETSISGAVLGLQAFIYAGFFLWFRAGEKFGIFVRNFFSFDLLDPFMSQLIRGALNTLWLAFLGQGFGMLIGIFLALLVLSNRVVVRAPARTYINVFRGTPLLMQLSIGYLGIVLGLGLGIRTYTAAILILALNTGAYSAEIFRAGIQSLERGQLEAARSLGMSYLQAMAYVVVPQAIRRVIPPLMNEFVILIKDTSLISILGVTFEQRELLAIGRDAYSETANATPFMASTLGYLVITLPLIRVVTWLERKLRSGLVGIGA